MCGVVAVLRRRSTAAPPDAGALAAGVDAALASLATGPAGLAGAADGFDALDRRLRGPAGIRVLVSHPDLAARLEAAVADARSAVAGLEADLDAGALSGTELEAANAAIVRLKDALWAIAADRLRAAREVAALAAGPDGTGKLGDAALEACWSIHVALSAIHSAPVRGAESYGVFRM